MASRFLAVVAWSLLSIDTQHDLAFAAAAPQARRLEDRVRDYIARFERDASALAAEEDYVQRIEEGTGAARVQATRWLRSDYVLVKPADTEPWLGYRDVFEVDGAPVRDRGARLQRVLAGTSPDSAERAVAFVREGSRFNLGPERTINTPTLPLQLLARANQDRLRLRAPRGWERQTDVEMTFAEGDHPTLVRTPEGAGVETSGVVRVRVSDGAVLHARLIFKFVRSRGSKPPRHDATMSVDYAEVPDIPVLVPVRMVEELPLVDGQASGIATYSNYRRFQTSVRIR